MHDCALLLGNEPQHQVQKYVFTLNIHSTSHKLLCRLDTYRNVTTGMPGYPSIRRLAKELHCSALTIQRHLSKLENLGLIKRQFCFQVIEGGVARQTTSYYHLTKLTIGKTELRDQILALKLPKVVTPNKVRNLRKRETALGVQGHPPGIIHDTPMNYINTNDPNLEQKTIFLNTTNTHSRDLRESSFEPISVVIAETQAVVDAMPKVDPAREREAEILIEGYEQEMGKPVPQAQRNVFIPRYAKGTITMYEMQQQTKAISADPILRQTTFSINRLFDYKVAVLAKNGVVHEIKRAVRKAEEYGLSDSNRVMMTKGLAKFCHDDPRLMHEAIVIAMDKPRVEASLQSLDDLVSGWGGQVINF